MRVHEGHLLGEESTRHADLEKACRGLCPTTRHNGCTTLMGGINHTIINVHVFRFLRLKLSIAIGTKRCYGIDV